MNILIDILPKSVKVDDEEYSINTNFRINMMFELLMQDDSFSQEEKLYMALELYYNKIPDNITLAVDKMLWFYKCGKEDVEVKQEKDNVEIETEAEESEDNKSKIYSFEHDDEYIYSAFLDQYGIDLQDIENLHWWKFKALFKGLKEDNLIFKIMSYRSIKISNDMSDTDKKYYRKMKEIYALPDNRTEEEKAKDFDTTLSTVF